MAKLLFLAGNLSKVQKINTKNPVAIGKSKIEAILFSLEGKTEAEIRASWQPALVDYLEMRAKYLLYADF